MKNNIFIDTCIWIDYFRGRNHLLCNKLDQLIMDNLACCNGIVLAELLYGARGENESQTLSSAMQALTIYSDTPRICMQAGHIGAKLRKHGITIPLTDCIIAAQCLDNDLSILSLDRHFDDVAAHFPLTRQAVA